jgi:hypothetical protein
VEAVEAVEVVEVEVEVELEVELELELELEASPPGATSVAAARWATRSSSTRSSSRCTGRARRGTGSSCRRSARLFVKRGRWSPKAGQNVSANLAETGGRPELDLELAAK